MAGDTQKLIIQLKARGVKLTQAQLKQLNATTASTKASMMAMGLATTGAIAGIYALGKALSSVVKTGKEFEQSMANLKAISQATGSEMLKLESTARRLGASTKYTATEVGGLQTEFAKLGFSVKDIENATGATLALASAVGADLAVSAEVAGQTVRGFGLQATQTSKVTDIMALSFSRSALDMRKFTDSMKYVAPVAKMAGFEMGETTAVLGVLANAGIDGSLAGTALRTIFLELSNESSELQQALGGGVDSLEELVAGLENLSEEGVTTEEMLGMVNKRAVSAFSILLDGTDTLSELGSAFDDAGGSAQRMADIQLDTLEGKLTILNSAWQGFSIALYDSMEQPLQNATEALTGFLQSMTSMIETPLSEALEQQKDDFENLVEVLKDVNTSETTRKRVIDNLKTAYPEYLGNLNLEKASLKEISDMQEKATESMTDRISQQKFKQDLDEVDAKLSEAQSYLYDLETKSLEELNMAHLDRSQSFVSAESIREGFITQQKRAIQNYTDEKNGILDLKKAFEDWLDSQNAQEITLGQTDEPEPLDLTGQESEEEDGDSSTDPYWMTHEIDEALKIKKEKQKELDDFRKASILEREELLLQEARAIAIQAEEQGKVISLNAEGNEQIHQFSVEEIQLIADKMDAGMGYIEAVQTALEESGIQGVQIFTEEAHLADLEKMAEQLEAVDEWVTGVSDVMDQYAQHRISSITKQHKATMKALNAEEKAELDSLKKSETFQRASTDRKKQMEDELTAKYEEAREKERESSNREIKRQFEVQKLAKYATTIMSTATAVMKAFETNPMGGGMPGSALAIATGAVQLATISAQKAPTMALGGMIGGSLHSAGGTPIMAEKDEFIMNRQAVENIGAERLDSMNSGGGGEIVINVTGNVMTDEYTESELIPRLREAIRRGERL